MSDIGFNPISLPSVNLTILELGLCTARRYVGARVAWLGNWMSDLVQILMISGVGPAKHLKSMSIPVVHDLPGVGQHLMDHPVVNVRFRVKRGESLNYLVEQGPRAIFQLLKWRFTGKGPMTTNVCAVTSLAEQNDLMQRLDR